MIDESSTDETSTGETSRAPSRPAAMSSRTRHPGDPAALQSARYDRLTAAAAEVAPRLTGLTIADAQAVVDRHEGVSVRFTTDAVTADLVYGRITAFTKDGIVMEASAG